MSIWSSVARLKGRTLRTLDQGKSFDVLHVTDEHVLLKLHGTGRERMLWRKEIEGAYAELTLRGSISRAEIEERHSPRNPAYVAAILAATEGIVATRRPIVLSKRER